MIVLKIAFHQITDNINSDQLLRELNDLYQLMKSDESIDYEKVWDDFLVVRQKAINFELDLPEMRKLEQEILKRRVHKSSSFFRARGDAKVNCMGIERIE